MKFTRWVFTIAGVYGVVTVAPLYFMEQTIGKQDPPPITHPMFFYGFVGVTRPGSCCSLQSPGSRRVCALSSPLLCSRS